ncbi:hypothetical protein AJ85_06000 [Alkalihalobacillus alcalophilus ATCC 27647 = CGMCC 1.3604]|uniref:Uncharacterized protein n=1 Tax=Alkalihalobacillus alcalophilus ATCC 27647 = CGMCC 1.3604 TaxID=1218173 RepID=A0A094WLF2_ALKAL|nr:hypothetical protein [Alkalihalobacillus alcalophilus]KGA97691.1 hypothetical protein BALCAV_0208635 [Alkalihalobacillus alcalophilus ATCC 27647 = CGMCC 1.3604]MED1562566.1 hypothetical protein [Alkalihalobacillus alcalophilus]THG91277.1 hypothetical protein AJ85_06000 [Alkalihalobacillus alcalophilus ATCC 27647 = CGMCC 1.3604]
MEKQKYYINLNPISMDDISPTKIGDGQLIEYEIEATETEKKDLANLLHEVQKHDLELSNLFSFEHFDQSKTDIDQEEYQKGMDDVYEALYRLGTPETKRIIEEIHLRNREH